MTSRSVEKVTVIEHDGNTVLRPRGYLNGPLGEALDNACGELLRNGKNKIVISFGETETMNTMGVASLVSVLEKAGRHGGTICFSNLLSANRQVLDVLDLSRAVLIFEDEAAACEHLQKA
jgi:anti-anti-sigma regulatory factor